MGDWLFGPGSMMWRINRESILLLGGPGTLLMQLAHPLVAAGVAEHSNFRADPFTRLRQTLDTMLPIVFGDRATAEQLAAKVGRVHASVRGRAADGRSYDARDPNLLLWVHATLVDSSIRVYEACVEPLTDEERARYYDETKVVADLFHIPAPVVPDTLEDLRAWMRERIETGEVVVTPTARELARPVLMPLPLVPWRVAEASAFVTAALLPEPIRRGYGLKVGRSQSALLAAGRFASRRMLPLLPTRVRLFPAARTAHRSAASSFPA